MKIGIYKITSPANKVYIGQSIDIKKRLNRYKILDCKGQIRLYRSLVKYGWEAHKFEIIEYCEIKELTNKERYWQEYYEVINKNGLNCKYVTTLDKTGILSNETKIKISKGNIGKCKGRTLTPNQILNLKLVSKEYLEKLILDTETGIFYSSAKELCKIYNFKYSTLVGKLNNKRGYYNNYRFKYV